MFVGGLYVNTAVRYHASTVCLNFGFLEPHTHTYTCHDYCARVRVRAYMQLLDTIMHDSTVQCMVYDVIQYSTVCTHLVHITLRPCTGGISARVAEAGPETVYVCIQRLHACVHN